MNTIEVETKTLSETKLELMEWIVKMDIKTLNQFLEIKNQLNEDDKKEKQRHFLELAGSWQSEETGEELVQQLYKDRRGFGREIEDL